MSVEAQPAPARGSFSRTMSNLFRQREIGVLAALIILIVIMSLASPYFLEPQNIFNVLRNMSSISIIAIGMTMVIITGGIDLSVGSVLAMCAMFTARIMVQFGVNPWVACLAGLALGCLAGLTNGLIITKVQVTAFIATLGMMSIARGLTYLLASGLQGTVASNMPMRDAGLNFLGGGYIGPVPMPVIEMFVLVIIGSLFLANTVLGRQIYGVGSNEQASRLSGVDVDRVRIFCYTLVRLARGICRHRGRRPACHGGHKRRHRHRAGRDRRRRHRRRQSIGR